MEERTEIYCEDRMYGTSKTKLDVEGPVASGFRLVAVALQLRVRKPSRAEREST